MIENDACVPNTLWKPVATSYHGQDAGLRIYSVRLIYLRCFFPAASLALNLEKLIVDAILVTKTISTSRDEVREIFLTLERLRLLLSAFLTPGINDDVDSICYGKLGVHTSSAIVGLSRFSRSILNILFFPTKVFS